MRLNLCSWLLCTLTTEELGLLINLKVLNSLTVSELLNSMRDRTILSNVHMMLLCLTKTQQSNRANVFLAQHDDLLKVSNLLLLICLSMGYSYRLFDRLFLSKLGSLFRKNCFCPRNVGLACAHMDLLFPAWSNDPKWPFWLLSDSEVVLIRLRLLSET